MIEKLNNPVYVTQPSMPPLNEFSEYLEQIWSNKILTNNGPFHKLFEAKLAEYLGVNYLSVFSNGTLALITALQALRISGEVITTPYSFVATTHSLWWNNIKPVFADIESTYLNLDPLKVEAAISPLTTAIMPVHVYGNPCQVDEFQKLADTYGLKIIYDAAHAFGVKINNESILKYGDLSILSFHATKAFNTIEGGAIICHDSKMKERIDYLKNFGFAGETKVIAPGINAKMNEIQAAYGLIQLKYIDQVIEKRIEIIKVYRENLKNIPGVRILDDQSNVRQVYTYFPILIEGQIFGKTRDWVYEELKKHNIFGRRYFFPLISQFPSYRGLNSAKASNLPIAEEITKQVICLPIYPDLDLNTIEFICKTIKKLHNRD